MAAAVSDYVARKSSSKIKRNGQSLTLTLDEGPDILSELGEDRRERILVGFAAETESVIDNARAKLDASGWTSSWPTTSPAATAGLTPTTTPSRCSGGTGPSGRFRYARRPRWPRRSWTAWSAVRTRRERFRRGRAGGGRSNDRRVGRLPAGYRGSRASHGVGCTDAAGRGGGPGRGPGGNSRGRSANANAASSTRVVRTSCSESATPGRN